MKWLPSPPEKVGPRDAEPDRSRVVPSNVRAELNESVTGRMHRNFTQLVSGLNVGEALDWLRTHPPPARVIYFYVVDAEGRLVGVVPTRRLLLSPPDALVSDIMVRKVVALPKSATVLDACEFFIQHRLLAFPVIDSDRRLVGMVDIDLYNDQLNRLRESTPAGRLLAPLTRYLRIESLSGLVLLVCTAIALIVANSGWSDAYFRFWQTPFGFNVGGYALTKPLLLWINDGLMTLFFFVVGLEIKREIVSGELSTLRKAALPAVAALGGMIVPAAVYLAFQWGQPTVAGWGIPMATDIAFVVGFLALLGSRVPHGLKVLLLSLAIADDIGAVIVIALVYSTDLAIAAMAVGAAGFGVVLAMRWLGVQWTAAYVVVGAVIWLAFVKSGIHPTVAGVLLGLLTPCRQSLREWVPINVVADLFRRLGGHRGEELSEDQPEADSLVERLLTTLHPWVAYLIMPVFALANAGVSIDLAGIGRPVVFAVAAGLVIGKPIGIALFSFVAIKAGLTQLPDGVNVKVLVAAGCLAGIGFTMSLFIAGLALQDPYLNEAKIGILIGSAISAVLGCLLLLKFLPRTGHT
jgi:NhaA family Na+:H+ antiporter